MTDKLLTRLDAYVIALLDEAERPDCGDSAKGDTQQASEEGPVDARPRATLMERVAVLKSATAWVQVRAGKKPENDPEPEPEPEPPEIDRYVTRLQPKGRTARR